MRAGWKCDFISTSRTGVSKCTKAPLASSLRYPSAIPLLDDEYVHMEYFQIVCLGEFALFFELSTWGDIILQGTLAEPALHHAAIAIGALSRSRYHPEQWRPPAAIAFSLQHYSMAIHNLHRRLDGSCSSLELAFVASVIFCYVEFLLGLDGRIKIHVRAGYSILEDLFATFNRKLLVPNQDKSDSQPLNLSDKHGLFADAVFRLIAQVGCSSADG